MNVLWNILSDATKEFISKAMMRLYRLLGCDKTTTLAHHPTGNAKIKRLWLASCQRQRTKEQYELWENMSVSWNTSGTSRNIQFWWAWIIARSIQDTWIEESGDQPIDLITQVGIEAMRVKAKAFEKQIQNMRQETAEETVKYKSKGPKMIMYQE